MTRRIRLAHLLMAQCLLLAAALPVRVALAGVGEWTSTGPPDAVTAVSVHPTNELEVLAAGRSGVWRTADGGGTWQRIATTGLATTLRHDPLAPGTVYGASADSKSVLKSADGGATWRAVFTGEQSTQVRDVLPDPANAGVVLAAGTAADGLAQLWRSADGGATWTPRLAQDQRGAGGIGQTAVTSLAGLPAVPGLLFAGLQVYHGGSVLKSTDGGATWTVAYNGGLTPLASPIAIAAGGTTAQSATVYASYTVTGAGSLVRSEDGGATWSLARDLPPFGGTLTAVALVANPLRGEWVYAAFTSPADRSAAQQTGVFASPDAGRTWHRAGGLLPPVAGPRALALAVPSRTLYAGGIAEAQHGVQQLTIAWAPVPRFTAHYERYDGLRLLGTGISLELMVGRYASQYFEKGRLEDHTGESMDPNWQLMYGLLVDELQTAGSTLPVGGDVSTLTYAGLRELAAPGRRVPPPAGYPGSGTFPIGGMAQRDTFVPFSADLSGAPGHVVPGFFWDYVNRTDLFPGGWLHDVGLPISPAVTVRVTKLLPEGPAERTITVQAFQRTVLTEDPLNSPDWRVERANVGTDFRKHFPAGAGP